MKQPDLFGDTQPARLPSPPKERAFDGETYKPKRDYPRLKGQMLRVYDAMQGGRWLTLAELAQVAGGSEAGVSARLRDLRKAKYGAHVVERQYVVGGLHRYRLTTETT